MSALGALAALLVAQAASQPPLTVSAPLSISGRLSAGLCLTLVTSAGATAAKWCPVSANVSRFTNAAGTAKLTIDADGEVGAPSGELMLGTDTTITGSNRVVGIRNNGSLLFYGYASGSWLAEGAFYSANGYYSAQYAGSDIDVVGTVANGAAAVALKFYNTVTLSNATAKIAAFCNDDACTTEKLAITSRGSLKYPSGAAACSGTATLVGGTVTVSTSCVQAASRVQLTVNTPGGTVGIQSAPVASIVAGTSFVINSSSGADTSTVNWTIDD